jgi:predicted dehydrogenase
LIAPSRVVERVEVVAVAARDHARARTFATRHGIPTVHESYEALLADAEIDAVYNPLPNSHHGPWSIRALDAGKHVLCEKPLASNADEARRMQEAAARSGRVLAEAFHWRYHALAGRIREILASGEIGRLQRVEASLCFPLPTPNDIRWRFELSGGALMDAGCYPVSIVRYLADAEPEVVAARAKTRRPDVDRWMEIDLRFPGGIDGFVRTSMWSRHLLSVHAAAIGDAGELRVTNPVLPHLFHRLTVRTSAGKRREKIEGASTYVAQLRAFRDWIAGGPPMPTDAAHGVANMEVIDAAYRAAGLPVRPTLT